MAMAIATYFLDIHFSHTPFLSKYFSKFLNTPTPNDQRSISHFISLHILVILHMILFYITSE